MSVDLRLLPQYDKNADFSHDVLSCDRDYEMFELIRELEKSNGRQVKKGGINTFVAFNGENCHYGKTEDTAYGLVMIGVQVKKLKEVLSEYVSESWKNKAIIAFINELPDDLEIWLYWH